MVPVDHFIVVAAKAPAAVRAELRGRFVAALLMLFQFLRASEASDVADFGLLACLKGGVERGGWCRFNESRRGFLPCCGMCLGLGLLVRLGLGACLGFRFLTGLQV